MEPDRHLEILLAEGALLAAMPPDALDAPVPTLPDWTLERVVRHTGKIHQWVAAVVAAGPDADLDAVASTVEGIPTGPACLPAYADALAAVHAALAAIGPDEPVASFIGASTARFWCRRQAYEVLIHRFDAADAVHAAGGPPPAPTSPDVAADGIDEWARVFLGTRWNQRYGPFPAALTGRTVHVHGTDDDAADVDAEWLFSFHDGAVEVTATHAKGDVALRGPAQELLLTLWRRRPLNDLELIGDRELAETLHDLAKF